MMSILFSVGSGRLLTHKYQYIDLTIKNVLKINYSDYNYIISTRNRRQFDLKTLKSLLTRNKIVYKISNLSRKSYTMSQNLDTYFNTALKLAKQAGQIVRELNYTVKTVKTKSGDIDLVTETDQKVEALLIKGFSCEFPDHKFIGEETVADGGNCNLTNDPTWIIDPIDGTMNFVHGFPHSCISIGLFINKEAHVAIVYNPVLEQLFTAQKGKGAFLNENRIKVSGQTELSKALLCFEIGTSRDDAKIQSVFENMQILTPLVQGTRSLGSAALNMAMVALGAADAYYECGIHIWDIAAGELLVKEAGGVVIDPAGCDLDHFSRRVLCASSQELAEKLAQKLIQYYPTPRD